MLSPNGAVHPGTVLSEVGWEVSEEAGYFIIDKSGTVYSSFLKTFPTFPNLGPFGHQNQC